MMGDRSKGGFWRHPRSHTQSTGYRRKAWAQAGAGSPRRADPSAHQVMEKREEGAWDEGQRKREWERGLWVTGQEWEAAPREAQGRDRGPAAAWEPWLGIGWRRCSEVNVMIWYWPPSLVSGTVSLHFVVLKARQSDWAVGNLVLF